MLLTSCGSQTGVVHLEPKSATLPPGIWIASTEPSTTNICVQFWPMLDLLNYQCVTVGQLRAIVGHLRAAN